MGSRQVSSKHSRPCREGISNVVVRTISHAIECPRGSKRTALNVMPAVMRLGMDEGAPTDGENDPAVLPRQWPQAGETASFTPSLVVPHVAVCAHRLYTTNAPPACSCSRSDPLPHHRAFHAGAVLGVVNALRCASTRPAAGPSGIDDASARHVSGSCAMEVTIMAPWTS